MSEFVPIPNELSSIKNNTVTCQDLVDNCFLDQLCIIFALIYEFLIYACRFLGCGKFLLMITAPCSLLRTNGVANILHLKWFLCMAVFCLHIFTNTWPDDRFSRKVHNCKVGKGRRFISKKFHLSAILLNDLLPRVQSDSLLFLIIN